MHRRILVKEWVLKAEHDFETAKLTLKHKPALTDIICFHSQQTVEKYLKAYCIHLEISFERSHDLIYLLDIIRQKTGKMSDPFYEMCEELNAYAVEVRYPDDWNQPAKEDAASALKAAWTLRKDLRKLMKI